jgi:hypothetical protein
VARIEDLLGSAAQSAAGALNRPAAIERVNQQSVAYGRQRTLHGASSPGKQPEYIQAGRASNRQRAFSARMSSQFAIGDIPMLPHAAAGSSLMT